MRLGLVGALAGMGLLALAGGGTSEAAVLTIDLNNYASAVDTTPGVLMGTMTVKDVSGGVDVTVALDTATLFAVSGGHITIAWNVDPATAATKITPTSPTYNAEVDQSPPGCVSSCGTFSNGLQGTWHGTAPPAPAGPIMFFLAGVTTSDFVNNDAGFMGAIDALGPAGTGEIAGTGSVVSTPRALDLGDDAHWLRWACLCGIPQNEARSALDHLTAGSTAS